MLDFVLANKEGLVTDVRLRTALAAETMMQLNLKSSGNQEDVF